MESKFLISANFSFKVVQIVPVHTSTTPECAVWLILCLDVLYQIRVLARNHIMNQTSVNLVPCFIKHTRRVVIYRSIISLIKITHQVWHDHSFIQRNKVAERAVGVEVRGKQDFPYWGNGVGVPPLGENLIILSHREKSLPPPVYSPTKFLSPTKS